MDNVIWVVNTKDEADLAYLDKILARSPLYKTHVLPEQVGWPDYAKIWRIVDSETMYIKIDDDIVRSTPKFPVTIHLLINIIGLVCR